jgi:hypothetical protein
VPPQLGGPGGRARDRRSYDLSAFMQSRAVEAVEEVYRKVLATTQAPRLARERLP